MGIHHFRVAGRGTVFGRSEVLIPLHWSVREEIPDPDKIIENYRREGGAIVEYQHVWSAFVISVATPKVVWVPPTKNRVVAGLKHTVFCLFLGWWSITGFFWTIGALIKNLMGGIDVTAVFTTPPPGPGQSFDAGALLQLEKARRIQALAFAGALFLLLAVLVAFLVLPALRSAHLI